MNQHDKESNLRRQIEFLYNEGDTFEVCLIGVPSPKNQLWDNSFARGIVAGWFVDVDKAVAAVMEAEELVKPTGIYLTLNPCNPQMRSVANEVMKPVKSRTQDQFIDRIENFFIDVDPIRPSGTSSSVSQLSYALDKTQAIMEDLPGKDCCMFALS